MYGSGDPRSAAKCVNHPDRASVAQCRKCRNALCDDCKTFLVNRDAWCEPCGNALIDETRPRWALGAAAVVVGWGLIGLGVWAVGMLPIYLTIAAAVAVLLGAEKLVFQTTGGAPHIVKRGAPGAPDEQAEIGISPARRWLLVGGAAVVLVAVMLTWRSVRGRAAEGPIDGLPTKVWGGGAATVVVDVDANDTVTVHAWFERSVPSGDPTQKRLEASQLLEPGSHQFTIDVPASTSGRIEAGAKYARGGARVRLVVKRGGAVIGEDSANLETPFLARVEIGDLATGTAEKEGEPERGPE
jgi:hypothetical protein